MKCDASAETKKKKKKVYERSNPAPELMACKSFALRILSSVYIGSFSKLTQVLAVGNRSLSLPASRIANFGTSSLNPLLKRGSDFEGCGGPCKKNSQ